MLRTCLNYNIINNMNCLLFHCTYVRTFIYVRLFNNQQKREKEEAIKIINNHDFFTLLFEKLFERIIVKKNCVIYVRHTRILQNHGHPQM